MKLFWKYYFNLSEHDTSTSQTDRRLAVEIPCSAFMGLSHHYDYLFYIFYKLL